jgi:hypothetical protein
MRIIQKKYGNNVHYNADLNDVGGYKRGNNYVEIGPLALSEDRGYAFSVARHELKHLSDYNRFGEDASINFFEIRAYKLDMRYYRSTSRDYVRFLRVIRNEHEYKGFAPLNPFILLNPFFNL